MGKPPVDLSGQRILVVEDTLLIADLIAEELTGHGCEVVGPVARVKAALRCVQERELDGALLDVNLGGEMCFPIAEALQKRGVPFVFITGYDAPEAVPARFQDVRRLTKPFDMSLLPDVLAEFP